MRKFRLTPKRIILLVLGIVAVIFFLWLLFGLSIDLFLPQRLESARQTWEANRPAKYQLTVTSYGFCELPCGTDLMLTVSGDQILEASYRGTLSANLHDAPFELIPTEDYPRFHVEDYTMDALFRRAAETIAGVPSIYIAWGGDTLYDITFDPKQGYITQFLLSNCGRGLLGPVVGDCHGGYRVIAFQSLA
jgi:hypothetical protein